MAARGRGFFFPIYLYRKLKKFSCQKLLDQLQYNLAVMFLWWPSTKIVQAIWIRQKTWPPGGGAYFPIYIDIENFKNLLVRNHWTDFHTSLQKCFFGDPLPTLFEPFGFIKNMATRGRGLFSIYIYIENFKNLLVRNYWTSCNIIWQNFSFGDPLPRLFKPFGFVKKHGRQGAGLIVSIYPYRNLKNKNLIWWSSNRDSSNNMVARGRGLFSLYIYIENFNFLLIRNQWTDFLYNLAGMFFGNPLPRLFKPSWFVNKYGCKGAGLILPIYLYRKLEKIFLSETTRPISV